MTLRTVPVARALRRRDAFRAIRFSLCTSFKRDDFRICHVSIQDGHLHLLVEADDKWALARGMQGFQISCARGINRAIARRTGTARRGRVFADRYHARVQATPRQMRNTLAYVLCNWRKHGHAHAAVRGAGAQLDPYSTAALFDGWRHGGHGDTVPLGVELLPIALPHSWLLTTGWRRHGLLAPDDRPGPRPSRVRVRVR